MARRTKEDALKTREQLLDAAEHVFCEKGVSHTSLKDIANAAGLTRGALYWHFRNKHDVFEAMADRQTLPLEGMKEAAADPAQPDPLGRLRELLMTIVQEVTHNPHRRRVYEIILHKVELTAANEPLATRHRRNILGFTEIARRILTNAIDRGQLPSDLDVDLAVMQLDVQLTGILYLWLLLPDTFDFEHRAERLIDTTLDILVRGFPAPA